MLSDEYLLRVYDKLMWSGYDREQSKPIILALLRELAEWKKHERRTWSGESMSPPRFPAEWETKLAAHK